MHDLIIANGRLIDAGCGVDGPIDVGIKDGRIAELSPSLGCESSRETIDAHGLIVTPGLIDLHAHVYHAFDSKGNHPDTVGVGAGVTTVVDAGSAGSSVFGGFPEYVIPAVLTRIYCLLNLGRTGLLATPEIVTEADVDADGIRRVVAAYPSLIRGLKFRATGTMTDTIGPKVLEIGLQLAAELGRPLMVHIGQMDTQAKSNLTREVLTGLRAGDILSHVYTGRPGAVVGADGKTLPELNQAIERGVLLDVGHGRSNISFRLARRLLAEGVQPYTISGDWITRHVGAPTFGSLTEVMSQFLALGLELKEVVRMVTQHPAKALGLADQLGSLAVGRPADLTLLELREGPWRWADVDGETVEGRQAIVPVLTVKGGRPLRVDLSPRFTKYGGPLGRRSPFAS